jgi:hypothetical protein
MRCRQFGAMGALLALLGAATAHAEPYPDWQYPDWKGQWLRKSAGTFDPDKPFGLGQQAPLTPEYQKVLEDSVESQANGGQGNNPMAACIPPGMPRMMIGYGGGFEFLITPGVTYAIQGEPMMQFRRIFTDGRSFPKEAKPTFSGYSIGRWEGRDDRYDTLVIETRFIRGPRAYDSSGLPFHVNNRTVVHERIYLDRDNPNVLRDDVTVIDDALTRPWSVSRTYHRQRRTAWLETICGEDEHQVKIGKEQYFLGADGFLMPTRRDQPPPDLRNFK